MAEIAVSRIVGRSISHFNQGHVVLWIDEKCDCGFNLYKRLFETIEQFNSFAAGDIQFYCRGRIAYEEIFNNPRHSYFGFYQSWTRKESYLYEYRNEVF